EIVMSSASFARRLAAVLAASAALAAFAYGVGCSSSATGDTPATCNADPLSCKAGTTCWPTSGSGASLALTCIQSNASYGFGATCEEAFNVATCADDMTCDVTGPDASAGICTYFCSTARGLHCPPGYSCHGTHMGGADGPTIELCRKVSDTVGDGGTDPGTGV